MQRIAWCVASNNRALPQGGKLWDRSMKSAPLGGVVFSMPAGRGSKARTVKQEIRLERVSKGDGRQGQIDVICLIALQVDPPSGTQPVVWRLLTNRTASTLQEASPRPTPSPASCPARGVYGQEARWGARCQNPLAGHEGHRRLRARFAPRP